MARPRNLHKLYGTTQRLFPTSRRGGSRSARGRTGRPSLRVNLIYVVLCEILRCAQNDKNPVGACMAPRGRTRMSVPTRNPNLLRAAGARSRLPARSVLLHTSVCRGLHRRPAPRPTALPPYHLFTFVLTSFLPPSRLRRATSLYEGGI